MHDWTPRLSKPCVGQPGQLAGRCERASAPCSDGNDVEPLCDMVGVLYEAHMDGVGSLLFEKFTHTGSGKEASFYAFGEKFSCR
jgi:hypothetical protein